MFYITDEQITNPQDELYSLQEKYNVKISRSQSSDAVYIWSRTRKRQIRIGHPISRNSKHLHNFIRNFNREKVDYKTVDEILKEITHLLY